MATSLGNCGIQGAGPGRPKGSLNRFTNLKNAFLEAFERTGGIDSLTEWGKQPRNRRDFYRLLAKLLPKGGRCVCQDRRRFVSGSLEGN